MKDHIVPHVNGKKNSYEMWAALIKLFQDDNKKLKMVSRQKLRDTKMTKTDNVSSYLTRITQVRGELGVDSEQVDDAELVRIPLNGFSQPWHDFLHAFVTRENMPSWSRLWDNFT